jgi:hypothetical protein
MAIAFVGGVGNSNAASGTTLTTSAYTVTAGSLLVAVWRHYHNNVSGGTPTITISDSNGNTWTNAASATTGIAGVQDGMRAGIAYAMNATSGSTTFTFTISDSRTTRGIAILEYSGAATTSALSATATGVATGSTITSSTYSTSGNTVTVGVANTINNGNLADWTGFTVSGNATTARSPANYDTAAYIRDYISSGAFTSATSTASNNNGGVYKLIVSASFAESTITYTYARPASDVTTQWTPSTPGAAHYTMINETTPNDTNYIYSTAAGQTDEVGLQAMSTPVAGTSLTINYRVIGVTGTGASVTTSLYSGATLVKADTARTTDGTYAMTVTSAEWASVSNWSNMRLRFVSA